MAARRAAAPRSSWPRLLVSLSLLIVFGFAAGIVAGILWQEPGLVFAHLAGDTTEIAWGPGAASRSAAETARAAKAPQSAAAGAGEAGTGPVAPLPTVAAASPGRLSVQVGAFAERASAERLADSLREKGYPVYVSPGASAGDARWRVRVGPLPTREEAERSAARLKREEKLPTWVLDESGR